ncbi:MAG: hypothetical protein M9933_12245 [Chitinophagaceae bacterium]|nr:hypothetical protein [Chitinophagaceae bacterium]
MSLKHVKLPVNVLTNLYTAPLVSFQTAAPEHDPPEMKFLGSNEQQVTILVNEKNAVFLSDTSLAFLTSILKACKLNLSDVAVVNTVQPGIPDYTAINTLTQPRVVLLFGVSPGAIKLPRDLPHFQVHRHDQITYVSAPGLDSIRNDPSLKAQLWANLRQVFQLS